MWYCLKRRRPYKSAFGLMVGCWYEDAREPAIEHRIPRAYLRVDDEEVEVPLGKLVVRKTKADYSYAYNVTSGEEIEPGEAMTFDMSWLTVCPEGHRGPTTKVSPPAEHECAECGRAYPVRDEDSGLVLK